MELPKEFINSDVYVYVIFDKTILIDKVKINLSKIDISNYPIVIYIVKINSSTDNKIFKIIKE